MVAQGAPSEFLHVYIEYTKNLMYLVTIMFQFGDLISKAAVSDVGTAGTTSSVKTQAESSGRSYQTPIVVRDFSRRGGKLQPQDASTVDIHLPSKLTKYPKGGVKTNILCCDKCVPSLSLSLSLCL